MPTTPTTPSAQNKIPRVFISYSHDSQEHKKWVLDLAVRLRNSGVDAILDQWDLGPGDDLPHFMERNLREADRVLMICTERYVQKANDGHGGVGYEKMIVTAESLKSINSNKVIPLVRQQGSTLVPTFLQSKLFINFSSLDQFEFAFDELVRAIHGAPLFEKPKVGNNPFKPITQTPPVRTGDGVLKLMRVVVADFDKHTSAYSKYYTVVTNCGMSRILLDRFIEQAVREGLLQQDADRDVYLTEKGKEYAVIHKLIRE